MSIRGRSHPSLSSMNSTTLRKSRHRFNISTSGRAKADGSFAARFFVSLFAFVIVMLYICDIKYNAMIGTASVKVQTAFRLSKELIDRLKVKAQKENRSLNNYVETVLMDIAYDEPNDETVAAIEEARSGKALEKLNVDNLEDFVAEL